MRLRTVILGLLIALAIAPPVLAGPHSGAVHAKLAPRLTAALAPGAEPASVWVEFTDKGEQGPGDLTARLAIAERQLTDKARARRTRAGLSPLVDYLDLPIHESYVQTLEQLGYAPYGASRWFNRVAVRASGERLARLAELDFVTRIDPVETRLARQRPEPAEEVSFTAQPERERSFGALATHAYSYGQTYTQLLRLNVPAMHDSGYIGSGVFVCVLDEGFNYFRKHSATRNMIVPLSKTRDFIRGIAGVDAVQDTVDTPFFFQHGEWTLSTAGGNAPGVYLGPGFGATYALGRTEDSSSEKPIEMVYWGMGAEWADSIGCDIISSSLGYNLFPDSAGTDITYAMLDGHTSIVTRAAEIAASRGILVVNSAGNDGLNSRVGYKIAAPADANGDSVLAIGAVDSAGVHASFSSKGPTFDGRLKPDLSAQGVKVLMASAGGDPNAFVRNNGTSFSAPLVAGMAACLMQARPFWPATLIIRALRETASRANNPDTLYGYGIPNGLQALRWIPDTVVVPPGGGPYTAMFSLASANPTRWGDGPIVLRLRLGSSDVASPGRVTAYDATGRMVRRVWVGTLQPGVELPVTWDGVDAQGRAARPGLYFLRFEAAAQHLVLRLVSLR
ncbi:MAG: S8 family serine peptidase [Candidatus Eisenbacteria bacterium]